VILEDSTMEECVQIITTTDSKEAAEGIARELVENRLAACVQIVGPVRSVFWWDDKIEWATEWLCVAKTRGDLFRSRRVNSTAPRV